MTSYLTRTTSAAPLAVFRIAFGLLLFAGVIRFWMNGWIYELYIEPTFFFPFYGFEFVKPLGTYTYVLFFVCGLSALLVAIGFYYRMAAASLFLSFTYIELIDKSLYLNHYYFVSMLCLMMVFLPAHVHFSIDAWRRNESSAARVPAWTIDSIKLFVCFLYFFAGLAKINSDWLMEALPLKLWLPGRNDLPLIGKLFNYGWSAYVFSWMGCLYDLAIPFLLWKSSTRIFAYGAVVIFHVLTWILFPIGMFPFIMIATALIFFSPDFHQKFLELIRRAASLPASTTSFPSRDFVFSPTSRNVLIAGFSIFFLIQLALPFRYAFYPDELFWTEEGYRFSWRVMLMEKAGQAEFVVRDASGKSVQVNNREFLTPLQEKMMSTQPDMILQYARMLSEHYEAKGFQHPEVFVDSYVTLNGRLGKPLINPVTNLAAEQDSFSHKSWIMPFSDEIKGL